MSEQTMDGATKQRSCVVSRARGGSGEEMLTLPARSLPTPFLRRMAGKRRRGATEVQRFAIDDVVRSRHYPLGPSGVVVGFFTGGDVRRGWPMVAWDDRSAEGRPCNPANLFKEGTE